jgi:hypothetical protein
MKIKFWIDIAYGEEKIFCARPTRAAKTEQKYLVSTRQAQRTHQRRTSFICTLWVSIHLSFNSKQGPPLSSLYENVPSPPPLWLARGAGRKLLFMFTFWPKYKAIRKGKKELLKRKLKKVRRTTRTNTHITIESAEQVMLLAIKAIESVSRFLWQNFANICEKLLQNNFSSCNKKNLKSCPFFSLSAQCVYWELRAKYTDHRPHSSHPLTLGKRHSWAMPD